MNRNMSPLGIVFIVLVWLAFLIMLANSAYNGVVNLSGKSNPMFKTMDDILHGNS